MDNKNKKHKLSYVKGVDADRKTVDGYVSTYEVDRDGDRFAKGAWNLADYLKNPVVLWAHDSRSLPIGRNLDLHEDDRGLFAVTQFDDKSERAMEIFSLFERGFLNAFSVGFMVHEFQMEDRPNQEKGVVFTKASLYEYSPVTVPANPGALVSRDLAGLAKSVIGPSCIETIVTKSFGEQYLVVPPECPGAKAAEEPVDKAKDRKLEPALKGVIDMAKAAKGVKFDESKLVLIKTAIAVFNEVLADNVAKDPGAAELATLTDAFKGLAGAAAELYPDSKDNIAKAISQIDKALKVRPA